MDHSQPKERSTAGRLGRGVLWTLLVLGILLGLTPRGRICSICDVQGPVDTAWYRFSIYSIRDTDYDEYHTKAIWEDIYERECVHEWRYRAWVALLIRYEYGAPLTTHFTRGRIPFGLEALGSAKKEWAITAWESLRTMEEPRKKAALSALWDLGGMALEEKYKDKELPPDQAVKWWRENGKLFK